MARAVQEQVFSNATSTGTSKILSSRGHWIYTMVVTAIGVTTGATIKLQGSYDGNNWIDLATRTVSANGTTEDSVANKYFPKLRVNIASRTDGSYTVFVGATGHSGVGE